MPQNVIFPEKEDGRMEFTFDKIQNTCPSMYTKFEISGQSILKVIQAFHTVRIALYMGCSGPVVRNLNKLIMLQSTT